MSTVAAFLILSASCAAIEEKESRATDTAIGSFLTTSGTILYSGCSVHSFANKADALDYLTQHDGSGDVLLEVRAVSNIKQTKRPVYDVQLAPHKSEP